MRQVLCALLLAGLTACSDKANQQAQTEQPTAKGAVDSVSTDLPTTQLIPQAVNLAEVPTKLRLPGQLLEAWRWTDANGENLLVVFRTVSQSKQQQTTPPPDSSAVENMRDFERTAGLMARQYVRKRAQDAYTELWRLQDAVTDCALDMTLRLQPGSTTVTDLDENGHTETTLVYALACRGDISGASLKLIMRAGAAKYALRGSTIVQYDSIPAQQRQPANPCCLEKLSATRRAEGNTEGYYQTEAEFQSAPPAFLAFARQHWKKFSIETIGEHEDL